MTGPAERLDAVVLAGGRGSRLGGVDKASVVLDGGRLVDRAVAAVQGAGVRRCVVAGPARPGLAVPAVQEQPAFGGPVAGLAAGLAWLEQQPDRQAAAVLVLACDLVDPVAAVAALIEAWSRGDVGDGVHLVDPDGRAQWLAAIYRRDSLAAALAHPTDQTGRSMRSLVAGMRLTGVEVDATAAADVDTWEDLQQARAEEPPMSDLPPIQSWVEHLCETLGVDSSAVDMRPILDMARDVAHQVDRPAAPVSALIAGLAAAADGGGPEAVRSACERTAEAARGWGSP